jgi:hypothetical protein
MPNLSLLRAVELALVVGLLCCTTSEVSAPLDSAPSTTESPSTVSPTEPSLPSKASDEGRGEAASEAPPTLAPRAEEPRTTVDVVCRASWGAKQPTGQYERHSIRALTVHHSGVRFTDSRRAPDRMKIMQAFHQSSHKSFVDVAYHFVLDPNGNIYEGRPTWARGETKTDYDPTGHLLVCLLGDYNKQQTSSNQIESLAKLLAWAAERFDVPSSALHGHRDLAHTDCPGDNLHTAISDGSLTNAVSRLRSSGGVDLSLLCGNAGRDRVKAIQKGGHVFASQ